MNTPIAYVGIDPATRTGLAIIRPDGTVEARGVRIARTDSDGRVSALLALPPGTDAVRCAIEQPYSGPHVRAGLVVAEFAALWEVAASSLGWEIARMTAAEWRRHSIPGVADRERAKAAAIGWARRKFELTLDSDAADALGLAYAASMVDDRMTGEQVHAYMQRAGLCVSMATFNEYVRTGRFPAPDSSTSRKSRWWRRSTVEAWCAERIAGVAP